jgi:hypothetical protein
MFEGIVVYDNVNRFRDMFAGALDGRIEEACFTLFSYVVPVKHA